MDVAVTTILDALGSNRVSKTLIVPVSHAFTNQLMVKAKEANRGRCVDPEVVSSYLTFGHAGIERVHKELIL